MKKQKIIDVFYSIIYGVYWYNLKLAIKKFFYRGFYGWCPSDAWDIDFWFCNTLPKILRHLAKKTIGLPMYIDLQNAKKLFPEVFPAVKIVKDKTGYTKEEIDKYAEDWSLVLTSFADLLENSNANTCTYKNDMLKDETRLDIENSPNWEAFTEKEKEIDQRINANLARSLDIFAKLLPHLWW